ncbi:MAG: hypothetical protein LR001_00800 [Clostridiales bacterium]|nr:hypothetical protein [Clostridiales bacterium]
MKEVIATIIISVIILGLLLVGISLWRGNIEIIRMTAEQTHAMEKIGEIDFVPVLNEYLTGSEVISIIRYYSKNAGVEVSVSILGEQKNYTLETYDSLVFSIPLEMKFDSEVVYENSKIVKVNIIKN